MDPREQERLRQIEAAAKEVVRCYLTDVPEAQYLIAIEELAALVGQGVDA